MTRDLSQGLIESGFRPGVSRLTGRVIGALAVQPGRTLHALLTLCAPRTLWTGNALRTGFSRFAPLALGTLDTLFPLKSLDPLWAWLSRIPFFPFIALGALDTLFSLRALHTLGAGRSPLALLPLDAPRTLNTLRGGRYNWVKLVGIPCVVRASTDLIQFFFRAESLKNRERNVACGTNYCGL